MGKCTYIKNKTTWYAVQLNLNINITSHCQAACARFRHSYITHNR